MVYRQAPRACRLACHIPASLLYGAGHSGRAAGAFAVTTPRREYSEETKAAVMAALLAGQSISEIAREWRIPEGTVKRWSAAARGDIEPVRTAKKERIGELLIGYLELNLETLQAQVRAFADAEWLKQQGASELAVLHGVVADKGIRLLEALADNPASDEEDGF